jgi:hypothetical protein
MLTDDHKTKRMDSALKILTRYAQEGDEFLDSIVTGDETWGFHHTPEPKQQSLQWHHMHSPQTFAFGGTLDRRCHFKHISLKQSRFYHCQKTSTAHRKRIKVDSSVATIIIKNFPFGLHVMYPYFPDTPRTLHCIFQLTVLENLISSICTLYKVGVILERYLPQISPINFV